jgi:hypothetical protein
MHRALTDRDRDLATLLGRVLLLEPEAIILAAKLPDSIWPFEHWKLAVRYLDLARQDADLWEWMDENDPDGVLTLLKRKALYVEALRSDEMLFDAGALMWLTDHAGSERDTVEAYLCLGGTFAGEEES